MRVFKLGLMSALAMVAFVGMFSSEIIAQDGRLIGGGSGITVFVDRNFRGDAATYQNDMSNLPSRFNNKISSLRVGSGEYWQICDQTRYRGQCVTVSGEESDLRRNNWDNRISSMRRVTGGGGGGQTSRPPSWAVGTFYTQDPSTGAQITLSISNNGQVISSSMGSSSYGTYYRETIQMEGVTVRVQRAGNGIRTSRYDTGQVINYSRTPTGGGGPGWGGGGATRPPSWARGTFNGRDPATGANIVLTIGADGRVTSRSGRQVSYGTFNNNMIYMEGVTVRVEQAGRNNIRTTRVDTGQVVNYRKN